MGDENDPEAGRGVRQNALVRESVGLAAEELSACIVRIAETQDREAFIALFAHFAPRVKAYMMRSGASSDIAEDLAQEALLMVWRKAQRYDPAKAGASTWIFTIARNLRIDALRKERRATLDPDDPTLFPAGNDTDAHSEMERRQSDDRVRQAMARLPQQQREVVQLSFFDELPHIAIAERLNLPLGTVKSRIRLAFNKIRDTLGDDA